MYYILKNSFNKCIKTYNLLSFEFIYFMPIYNLYMIVGDPLMHYTNGRQFRPNDIRFTTYTHKEKLTNLIYPTFICYLFVHKIKINNRLNVFATIDRA